MLFCKRTFHILLFLITSVFFINCSENPNPEELISSVIKNYGGDIIKNVNIDFNFRDKHYNIKKNDWKFQYSKSYSDTNNNSLLEGISNKDIYREINGTVVELTEKQKSQIHGSINSVVYFALLPFPLNDKAAIKRYLGEISFNGKTYHKIKVTFSEDGGGDDFQDIFVFWINSDNYSMDYLAYYFHVNGGGSRLRKAVNKREVGGIIFADYLNYKIDDIRMNVEDYDNFINTDKLVLVSEINLRDIKVEALTKN